MADIEITVLDSSSDSWPATRAMLSEILIEVVAAGGSVSFMHPVSPEAAREYWDGALASAALDERIVLGAWEGDLLVGTGSLLLAFPVNQPHRAEVAKVMTRPSHRGRGVATALMSSLETYAVERRKTLLVLDTAVIGGAASLYERLGFTLTGEIPDFALRPHGGLTGTLIYWKRIGSSEVVAPAGIEPARTV
jgi:ribosomal protein S18 acetylase RimI-like enzyme